MSFSYWFVLLTVHIAIPAGLFFVVVFYTWRFFAFIRRKFIEFRHKVDGYDKVEKKRSFRNKPRQRNNNQLSNNQHSSPKNHRHTTEKRVGRAELTPSIDGVVLDKYRSSIVYDADRSLAFFNQSNVNEVYNAYVNGQASEFGESVGKYMKKQSYSTVTYIGKASIVEQVEFYRAHVDSMSTTNLDKREFFTYLMIFLELTFLEKEGFVIWQQGSPDEFT